MNIKICETEFINVENFEDFLKENLKVYYEESLNEYLEEVSTKLGQTGNTHYEIGSCYTKSKNPECYDYEVEYKEDKDNQSFITKIIF